MFRPIIYPTPFLNVLEEYVPPTVVESNLEKEKATGVYASLYNAKAGDVFDYPIYQHELQKVVSLKGANKKKPKLGATEFGLIKKSKTQENEGNT